MAEHADPCFCWMFYRSLDKLSSVLASLMYHIAIQGKACIAERPSFGPALFRCLLSYPMLYQYVIYMTWNFLLQVRVGRI